MSPLFTGYIAASFSGRLGRGGGREREVSGRRRGGRGEDGGRWRYRRRKGDKNNSKNSSNNNNLNTNDDNRYKQRKKKKEERETRNKIKVRMRSRGLSKMIGDEIKGGGGVAAAAADEDDTAAPSPTRPRGRLTWKATDDNYRAPRGRQWRSNDTWGKTMTQPWTQHSKNNHRRGEYSEGDVKVGTKQQLRVCKLICFEAFPAFICMNERFVCFMF